MAKVPFSKLQASINEYDTQISYINKAGEEIKYGVKHYLPFKDKLALVSRIINQASDDNGFYNPMKVKFYMVLETVYAYTNLSFTEKMKEDQFKLYDIFISTGIFNDIINAMFEGEWEQIQNNVWETINNIYNYKNSAMGIVDMLSQDYNNVNFDLNQIQEKLSDPEQLGFLKEIFSLTNAPMA